MFHQSTDTWITSRETRFLCFAQLKMLKASKKFSRSYLQRRKMKKRRQKEFLTTWLCLNCKKSLQQLRSCVIVKRGLLIWKMFLSLLNRRTVTWNLFVKQTMEMRWWWRNLFFSFSRAIFRETSAEMKVKTVNVIIKNKSITIFRGLYFRRP